MKKILIGTPIHVCKDYAMERWLKCVTEIKVDKNVQWKLFMVDNSQSPDYWKKVLHYCQNINFTNYELSHLEGMLDDQHYEVERLGKSREKIRQKLLNEDWDYWFSWECDLICPSCILQTLLDYSRRCDAVGHTYPLRGHIRPENSSGYVELESMGLMLMNKVIFQDYGFVEGLRHHTGDGPLVHEIISRWKWISLHSVLPVEHLAQ